MISGVAVAQPQLAGAEQEQESQPQFQWAVKPRHLLARWHGRHLQQTGLQPQSEAAEVQLTGALQLVVAVQEQESFDPQLLQQP